ncbi:hypothetical protein ANN_00578 [Periplaneta americana]|uniref:RNase H type-1 domain-containing protein n=1 Tax=Periplaneta americana TaxID=6978 RepID=A0ABQ8TSZ8_PERAM|nr:hypothetical protein ANN_00578 [Periplaneta americana]
MAGLSILAVCFHPSFKMDGWLRDTALPNDKKRTQNMCVKSAGQFSAEDGQNHSYAFNSSTTVFEKQKEKNLSTAECELTQFNCKGTTLCTLQNYPTMKQAFCAFRKINKSHKTFLGTDSPCALIKPCQLTDLCLGNEPCVVQWCYRGLPTNAVLPKLKKTELPTRYGGIHPKDNSVTIGNSGTVIPANIQIFTDGSKTEKHVGAGMVAEENSMEIYTEARRLDNECSIFQAELLGIQMAVDWIQQQTGWGTIPLPLDVRKELNTRLSRRRIGRASREDLECLHWPPRSPDLTPCNFFLWGFIKQQVYQPPLPPTIEDLRVLITEAIALVDGRMLQCVWQEIDYRLDVCRVTQGTHIEYM